MEVCPYLEAAFKIVGRTWNGLIINYLSHCPEHAAHFSDLKRDLKTITPRALSIKLTDLIEWGLVEKEVLCEAPPSVTYRLTTKGITLAEALVPIEAWAQKYVEIEEAEHH